METAQSSLEIQKTAQQLLILGNHHPLLEDITSFLTKQDVEIHHAPLNSRPQKIPHAKKIKLGNLLPFLADNSPDYFFLIADQDFLNWHQKKEHQSLLQKLQTQLSQSRKLNLVTQRPSLEKLSLSGKILLINQVYGPKVGDDHLIHRLFVSALTAQTITVPGDGLQELHPLYVKDAADQTLKLLLDPYLSEKKILLQSSESSSYLNLAYKIRSLLPQQTTIKFDEQPSSPIPADFTPSPKLINWQPDTELEQGLQATLEWYRENPPQAPSEKLEKKPAKPKKSSKPKTPTPSLPRLKPLQKARQKANFVKQKESRGLLKKFKSTLTTLTPSFSFPKKPPKIILSSLLIALVLYSLLLLGSGLTIYFGGRKTLSDLKTRGETNALTQKLTSSSTFFLRANTNALLLFPPLSGSQTLLKTDKLLHAFSLFLDTAPLTKELTILAKDIAYHTLAIEEKNLTSLTQKAQAKTSTLYEKLSYLSGLLPETLPAYATQTQQQKYTKLRQDLQTTRTTLLAAKNLLSVWPELTGINQAKKYAVLLQNDLELRPTGGFLAAYAIAEFDQGELFNFQVHDVYDADSQLKGHVDPPEPINEHLGEADWYLRDSNWDPDFPTAARRVEWFFDKTINQQFAGTIAINLHTLQDILSVVGPVEIESEEGEITHKNIFEKAAYHAELNVAPNSNKQKEFLSSLSSVLYSRLQNLPEKTLPALARALYSSLSKNHTLISLKDPRLATTFKALGWDGSLKSPDCPSLGGKNTCTQSYLYLVEANLGINKANYFLEKSADFQTTIDSDGQTTHQFTLTYQNTSPSNSWPAGDYLNYLRLYLPTQAKLTSIRVGDNHPPSDDLTLKSTHNKLEAGFLVKILPQSTQTVTITYKGKKLSLQNPLYSLYWQKQPGTNAHPLNITLNYPQNLTPTLISPQAELQNNSIFFSLQNSQDRRIAVQFETQ